MNLKAALAALDKDPDAHFRIKLIFYLFILSDFG